MLNKPVLDKQIEFDEIGVTDGRFLLIDEALDFLSEKLMAFHVLVHTIVADALLKSFFICKMCIDIMG